MDRTADARGCGWTETDGGGAVATLLLIDERDETYVVSRRAAPWSRLCARLLTWKLDLALARGVSPDTNETLSLRARALIGRRCRLAVAKGLRETLHDAKRMPAVLDPRLPMCREGVLAAAGLLGEIIELLTGSGAVDARGVAQLRVLLEDGLGPLYDRTGREALVRAVADALEALEPAV